MVNVQTMPVCGLNIVLRAYGVDEVIKKAEAERAKPGGD